MLREQSLLVLLAFSHGILGTGDTENLASIKVGVQFLCDRSFLASRMKEPAPMSSVVTYLNVMLHTAEVYFRELDCPKIKLYFVGLYNTTEEEEREFEVTRTIFDYTVIDGPFTLSLFQEWVERIGKFNESDIVILLTGFAIYDYIRSLSYPRTDGGISYLDGICTHLRVGLVYDKGRSFYGLTSLIAQIAHLLGTPWDEGYQAPDCLGKDGYLVRLDPAVTPLPMLSNCTKDYLLQKYQDEYLSSPCWMDTPTTIIERTGDLPADYFKQEEFCRAERPIFPNDTICPAEHQMQKTAPVCKVACCKNETAYRRPLRSSPDGTNCTGENGENVTEIKKHSMVCLSDQCVTL